MQDQSRLEEVQTPRSRDLDDWTIMPNSVTVNQTEPTNKIILVGFNGDIDANQLPI